MNYAKSKMEEGPLLIITTRIKERDYIILCKKSKSAKPSSCKDEAALLYFSNCRRQLFFIFGGGSANLTPILIPHKS